MTDRAVRPLDQSTWPAFAALVEGCGGYPTGCWCMAFHPEGVAKVGKASDAELNQQRKRDRVASGAAHAALVFDGDECVGWCQFGPPDELPRIKSAAAYRKELSVLPDWRITCFFVAKGHRRQGVSSEALSGALDLIAEAGGGVVEGYPEPAGAVPAGFLFNGALSTYEQLGFERDRMIGKHRWVMRRQVDASR